jgi:hypothetical protein
MIINVLIINSMFLHVDSRAPELPPVLSGVRVTQSHTIMTTTTLRDTKEMNKIYDFQSFFGL